MVASRGRCQRCRSLSCGRNPKQASIIADRRRKLRAASAMRSIQERIDRPDDENIREDIQNIIHWYRGEKRKLDPDFCPICGEKYEIRGRNFQTDCGCRKGHEWHICLVHKVIVEGRSNPKEPDFECSCKNSRTWPIQQNEE